MPAGKPRILLIYPPFYRLFKDGYSMVSHPLALGYLASAILKQDAWEVQTYNADFHAGGERISHEYIADTGFKNYRAHLTDADKPVWREIRPPSLPGSRRWSASARSHLCSAPCA